VWQSGISGNFKRGRPIRPWPMVVCYVTQQGSYKNYYYYCLYCSPSSGEGTYYYQQVSLLSRLHREQHNLAPPDPCHQFILDLQSWLEFLTKEGRQFILAMDANTVHDPDQVAQLHLLEYRPEHLTVDTSHDGKSATLVETCNLCLPLARQHVTRPFPASHIMGRNQIDYI
jgi:hypothetical protein